MSVDVIDSTPSDDGVAMGALKIERDVNPPSTRRIRLIDNTNIKDYGPNYCKKGVGEKLRNVLPSTNVSNAKKSNVDVEKPRNAQAHPNRYHSSNTSKHAIRSA
ncbi:unnamed protein product [Clonostachys chloroleuca]|uniref:Uncharacterized protein n=1 Tax=Clonostachys chloroleuca TaxID=1926264 RepID=A0AA35MJM2_9HYPO|nr:unnamed protein product [Clonostachys chloroleuca]